MNSVKDLIPLAKYAKPRRREKPDDDNLLDSLSQTKVKERPPRHREAIKADAGEIETTGVCQDAQICPGAGTEDQGTLKAEAMSVGVHKMRIPRLSNIRIRLGGKLPRAISAKTTCVEEEQPQEIAAPQAQSIEVVPEPEVVPVPPPQVTVKVIPTPKKRHTRVPEIEIEPLVPQEPKPLKVIRRRAAQEPKVFETEARLFPEAMLEGVKPVREQEG